MAHFDESKARELYGLAVASFDKNPDQAAHHRLTWLFLAPKGFYRFHLDSWYHGVASRNQLPTNLRQEIAKFRFILMAERKIEALHAYLSLEGFNMLGPVRVSLSNRQRLLEQRLTDDPNHIIEIINGFELCRQAKTIPDILNFPRHPAYLDWLERKHDDPEHTPLSSLLPVLESIIYRCDANDVYSNLSVERKEHEKDQRKEDYLKRKELPAITVNESSVFNRAARSHFVSAASKDKANVVVYSAPVRSLSIESLGSYLSESWSGVARARSAIEDTPAPNIERDVHEDTVPEPDSENVFFSVIDPAPGNKKQMQVRRGAGRSLRHNHMSVTVHPVFSEADTVIVGTTGGPSGYHHEVSDCVVAPGAVNIGVAKKNT